MGELLTHNMFAYCANDPINCEDPDGNFFGSLINKIAMQFGKKLMSRQAAKQATQQTAKTLTNGASKAFGGTRNLNADFNNGKKLLSHFKDHGDDFGYKTAEKYLNGARNFVMKKPTSTTQSFVSKEGTYFRYDTKTKEFGIVNQHGGISTYFKPEDGLKYWQEQVKKYKPR